MRLPQTGGGALLYRGEYRDFRRLLWARLGSTLGTWAALFALNVIIYDKTHSAVWVSFLLAAEFIPSAALSLAIGPLADRWPRQRLMIVSDIGGVLVFALMPFVHSPQAICWLAGFAGCAAALFRPGAYSGVPNLVPEEKLATANSLLQGSENLTRLLAPFVGGLMLVGVGAVSVFVMNSLSFAFSAFMLYRLGDGKLEEARAVEPESRPGHWAEVAAGLRLIRNQPTLQIIFLVWSVGTLAFGAVNVSEVILAKSASGYGAGDVGFALFVAASGAGIVVGNLLATVVISRVGAYWGYVASFCTISLGVLLAAIASHVVVGSAGAFAAGAGNGIGLVCNVTLIQAAVPDRFRGRVFALLGTLVQLATLVGLAASGPLTNAYGPRLTWLVAAAVLALATVNAAAVSLRRGRQAAPVVGHEANGALSVTELSVTELSALESPLAPVAPELY